MKRTALHHSAALLISIAFAGSAHAAFLCDNPPSQIDQRACEAAEQGPDVLRRFIDRLRPIHNLYFYDYVNAARLVAWEQSESRARAMNEAAKTAAASGTPK